jgi:UDP-N-acetylmuramoyl-tripeptide--D-alanyl-D-alanine ligase
MPFFSASDMAEWSGGTWFPAPPITINGVSNDTRTIGVGNLYFALCGNRLDGHDFVEEALLKGASGAVVNADRKITAGKDRPLLQVSDTTTALGNTASGYRLQIAPEIVAVTGSAGKSTVKEMTAQVLSAAMPAACTKGNWNNNIGLPLSILAMEKSTRIGVFEVGVNHPGELAPLCKILKPTWGIVTNVGPVHIEFFGSIEAIAEEKATLLRSLPADGTAVLNRDSDCFEMLRSAAPCKVITVSTRQNADYACISGDSAKQHTTIVEKASGDRFSFRMSVPGEHNVANAMFAVAVARGHGMAWDRIRDAIERYTALPMRWQRETIADIRVINDAYNANPLSMLAAIRTFADEQTKGAKWLILGGMLELGDSEKKEHLAIGKFAAGMDWKGLIVVGSLGKLIAEGAKDAGFDERRIFRCETNDDATSVLLESVAAGDSILLKASRAIHLEEVFERLKAEA